ncbi:voltage-dependent anion-selective channel [Raphidocelis subcapitata]|uniref:Voltage-dependent anion-selective channel n=1 Tax=Raphidocelis subcapitata TaxID=307507 RepID=A0A2V0P304_9CHLO|nr:voltage-dependent anion-selective channel [Raphidocelis subcapitata]|eukprot:GBF94248.1 voltage-dependent anion-selective channel [Raphidocelis subcapitata]
MGVAAYFDAGKGAREVLYGAREGLYQFDQRVALTTKTADGVSLVLGAINKGDKADLSLKSSYTYKNYGISALFRTSTDKVDVTANIDNVAPGLKAAIHATLPDAQSGKLLLDYSSARAHVRTTLGLNTQPKASIAATTAQGNLIYGVEGTFDTGKSEVTGYGVMAGWTAPDSQLVLQLTDKLETAKLYASHNYTKDKAVAAEVSRPVKGGDVTFSLGVLQRLENGALFKAKVNHLGVASLLYEQRLASGERLALSTQVDTINVGGKAPKVGVALDLA